MSTSYVFASVGDVFPIGATVGAYLPNPIPGTVPPVTGAALTTATVQSDGSLTFAGLLDGTAYVAYDTVSGRWRGFRTAPVTSLGVLPPHTLDPRLNATAAAANTASRTSYMRVQGMPLRIAKLATIVGGTQTGNICMAVFANTGSGTAARPGARKATTGSVACPALGEAVVPLLAAVDVVPGDWFALACDNATVTFPRFPAVAMGTAGMAFMAQENSAFPCPAVATPIQAGNAFMVIGVE